MKSLQNLSNVHIYQYTQMVNAPAGVQAGAARCCHRAKCFGLAVGLCRGLLIVCHFVATDRATRWVFTLVCNNKTAANRPALSARSEASLPGCVFIQFGRFNGRVAEVLQSYHVRSDEEIEATLHRYIWFYNQQLPQSALRSRPPLQAMKDCHKIKPELIKKQPYYLPGCDK